MADSHSSSRKQFKFEVLLERYLSNFFRIILTNLIFFIPLSVMIALYVVADLVLNGVLLTLVLALLVTAVFPFFAGVVLVTRNIARGDSDIKVLPTFIKGVKENFSRFLIYGGLFSVLTVFNYYSISIYSNLIANSWVFYILLFVCIIIAVDVLFMFFYVPVMSVTFELSFKHVVKNSFLMSFGEIKNNFFAVFALAVVLAIALTIVAFCTNVVILIVATILLIALLLPASCQTVTCFFVYDDMFSTIAENSKKSKEINDAISIEKDKRNSAHSEDAEVIEDYSDVDISTLKDCDEYIFYNGKMIKQSVLLKKVLEQRGQAQESSDNEED